ncbi:MAG: hypothetical protein HQ501_00020 [Rhodospirillales bacterium]|nr:hypothetical protein [Rhodospirillales bacterium]
MIEAPATPVGLHLAQEAIRYALQHERSLAAIAIPEEKAKADFEGNGPSSPTRGAVIDINV